MSIILFRKDLDVENELEICNDYLETVEYRSLIPENQLVVGRYSVLPFYKELERELELKGSKLVNSFEQHLYIADIINWYSDLKEYTPATYNTWYNLPQGSYVLKGKTNSRKHQWNELMFAPTVEDVPIIANRLYNDTFISDQEIIVREYIPLKQFTTAINGLPITNEWRAFYYKQNLLSIGFYWSNFEEHKPYEYPPLDAITLLNEVSKIVSQNTNFYVLDIAQTKKGNWILIEINDAQMSGLSCNTAEDLYSNLANVI
jgi:hypothetical protein